MLGFVYRWLLSKTTTFEKAKEMGEIAQEVEVYPSTTILVCGEGIYECRSGCDGLINAFGGGAATRFSPARLILSACRL